ncbi:hypothetical protein C0J50_6581 [Silurus asotus]|uniref:Tetraspanin n=1 Tax=Silurus asotus TaxID=30991 RepID=A0AAD5A309_SILAS|nr:hypothetical protein C0J50_6581 [Silurus asotus]
MELNRKPNYGITGSWRVEKRVSERHGSGQYKKKKRRVLSSNTIYFKIPDVANKSKMCLNTRYGSCEEPDLLDEEQLTDLESDEASFAQCSDNLSAKVPVNMCQKPKENQMSQHQAVDQTVSFSLMNMFLNPNPNPRISVKTMLIATLKASTKGVVKDKNHTEHREGDVRCVTEAVIIMALSGCGQICKWIVILFNILFSLLGLGLLAGALYLRLSANIPGELQTNHFIFMLGLCIAIAVVILITAVVGDCGSWSENKSTLSVYCSLMFLLAAASAIGGGVAFVNNKEFSNHVAEFYATIYAQYLIKGDIIRAFLLKLFHNAFDCCGLGGTMQTIMGITNICPQQTSILGIPISTSSVSPTH